MKIICEYCGCRVEADENMKCPQCCAPLGETIKAEEERLKKESEEKEASEKAKAEEEAAKAEKAAKRQSILNTVTAIGSALLGSKNTRERKKPPVPPRPYGDHWPPRQNYSGRFGDHGPHSGHRGPVDRGRRHR